ncbi:MAG: hypothetical protein MJE77_20505 [Proteobacteria bacterium]|nr:hypothetical protein [Pseudomonadota bacterium]
MFDTIPSQDARQDASRAAPTQDVAPGKTTLTSRLAQRSGSPTGSDVPVQGKSTGTTPAPASGTAAPAAAAKTPKQQLDAFVAMTAKDRDGFLAGLTAATRKTLADGLTHADVTGADHESALRQLFDSTPDAEQDTLARWMAVRFNIVVGLASLGGKQWTKAGLRRAWDVLQTLPPAQVENNVELSKLTRYDSTSIEGWASSTGEAAIGYGDGHPIDAIEETGAFTDPGDPLRNTNLFDVTVLHEIGHRVDPLVNASAEYCTTADGGGWQGLNTSDVATRMVTESNGAIAQWDASKATQKQEIIQALQNYVDAGSSGSLDTQFLLMPFLASLPAAEKTEIIATIRKDPVVDALEKGISAGWTKPDGGTAINGRIYQKSYPGQWTSYNAAARARKVSTYQFRHPAEWFAEAYSAYYAPGTTKGQLLGQTDPKTKDYFDSTVDTVGAPATASGAGKTPKNGQ